MKKWYTNKILKKLFLQTSEWNVAWKKNESNSYSVLLNPKGYWLADPLLFSKDNKHYLFVEAFEKKTKLGRIGVFEFNDNKFNDFKIILEKQYHLSYPFVFEYKNEIYMIPESSKNNSIELYKAAEFPNKWVYLHKLLDGNFVDTTLHRISQDEFQFYTYNMNKYEMVTGILSMKTLNIEIKKTILDNQYKYRAGGQILKNKAKNIRPVQNNKFFYGQSLLFIDCKTNKVVKELIPENIKTSEKIIYRRIHTYSKNLFFESVDLSDYYFDLFKIFKKVIRLL